MKNKRKILFGTAIAMALLLTVSCKKEASKNDENAAISEANVESADMISKIALTCSDQLIDPVPSITDAHIYTNIPYSGSSYPGFPTSVFDLFIPENQSSKVPLVIFVHGGGFNCGDKSDLYEINNTTDNGDGNNPFDGDIQWYINHGIAVASVNYRLLEDFPEFQQDTSYREFRIKEAIKDVRYCLQFIRYKSNTSLALNEPKYNLIDKKKIGMFGGSAGGAISISLAFSDEGKLTSSSDPILLESTRLKAVGHNNSQASYSPYHLNKIFTDVSCADVMVDNTEIQELNFMGLISTSNLFPVLNDPPIYIRQVKTANICPSGSQWVHHLFQARKLYNLANAQNKIIKDGANIAYSFIPADNIGIPIGGNIFSSPVYLMRDFMKLRL